MNTRMVITSFFILTLGALSNAESASCSEENCKEAISLKEFPVNIVKYEEPIDLSKVDVIPKAKTLDEYTSIPPEIILKEKVSTVPSLQTLGNQETLTEQQTLGDVETFALVL